jgi:hypothetical protein
MKPEPARVTWVAAAPAAAEEGVTDAIEGVGLLLASGGGVVVEPPPPPPQPAIAIAAHKITANSAHVERGMGRPVPMSLLFRRSEGNYISGCLPGKYLIWVVRWSYWLLDGVSGGGERGAAFDWVFRGGQTLRESEGHSFGGSVQIRPICICDTRATFRFFFA